MATLPEAARISVRPLIAPKVQTAIAFLAPSQEQATRAQQAALALMQSQAWRQQCASFAGAVR